MNTITGVLLIGMVVEASALEITSPDGRITLNLKSAPSGQLTYSLACDRETVLADSPLGLELSGGVKLGTSVRVGKTTGTNKDGRWRPVCGERGIVRDHYKQSIVELAGRAGLLFRMELRLYNEGAAWRYVVPGDGQNARVVVDRELTEFRFAADHDAWAVYSAQGRYSRVPVSGIRKGCERPLVVRVRDGLFVALAEANLVDFPRMKFEPIGGGVCGVRAALHGGAEAALPLTTPWRVVMIGESPGQLLERNDLIRNLCEPCAIEDTSWIRPGKVIREVTLTTRGGKACVDFAAANGLQYVHFDAGWYGHEYSDAADATAVSVDPKRSRGPLDLPEAIRYAKAKGIGVILYVNRRALERQLDVILPLYRKWGVAGVKYGFVQVGSQRWTRWLHEAIRKAAENQLMVDVHDEYRPTGYSRTYPNLMTVEGIAGDETKPTNEQTLAILFTRMLAGAGDNTVCYYNQRVVENACHAYQLAKAVCIYSPWQYLYWYDRPAASREGSHPEGMNGTIGDEPELEFYKSLPATWDDTRVLHGVIGEYAVIARRKGDEWFVGCMNAGRERILNVALDFLPKGRQYTAHIYSHDPAVPTRTHVKIERRTVAHGVALPAELDARGGMAIRLTPRR